MLRRPCRGECWLQPCVSSLSWLQCAIHSICKPVPQHHRTALKVSIGISNRRSHSLWSRRSSASGVTARRRTSLPAPGAQPLPPHPESPQAPAASRPRPEQPPDAAHPADVVPDAVADADSAAVAMQRSSTQPTDPGGGADRQQVSQASPAAGHDPQTHEQESATAAAAEHDGALQETARHADAPAPGTSPPRVPPLRLGSLGGGAARQPQAMQRWVTLTLLPHCLSGRRCDTWLVSQMHRARQGASESDERVAISRGEPLDTRSGLGTAARYTGRWRRCARCGRRQQATHRRSGGCDGQVLGSCKPCDMSMGRWRKAGRGSLESTAPSLLDEDPVCGFGRRSQRCCPCRADTGHRGPARSADRHRQRRRPQWACSAASHTAR